MTEGYPAFLVIDEIHAPSIWLVRVVRQYVSDKRHYSQKRRVELFIDRLFWSSPGHTPREPYSGNPENPLNFGVDQVLFTEEALAHKFTQIKQRQLKHQHEILEDADRRIQEARDIIGRAHNNIESLQEVELSLDTELKERLAKAKMTRSINQTFEEIEKRGHE